MNLSLRQCEFTHALALLIIRIASKGYQVKVQELNRTVETQTQYVKDGKSKTMNSRHLQNLAADIVLFKDGRPVWEGESYRQFGEYWEELGGRWGGRFGLEDKPEIIKAREIGWDSGHYEFVP